MTTRRKNRSKGSGFTRAMIWFVVFFLLVTNTFNNTPAAKAQSGKAEIVLGKIDKSNFPSITLDFSIKNARPNQLEPLKASQINIFENDELLPITRLESQYTGTHFMLAINPARNLALLDPMGVSNYEKIIKTIKTLGSGLTPESGDHFSLFINPDSEWKELSNFSEWLTALDSYNDIYGMRRLDQDLASLEMAINAWQSSELDQETVLLYLTPYIHLNHYERFIELINHASQLGLPLHIWMVLEYPEKSTPYADELREALEFNGGNLFFFSREEELPDPKSYIEGMGYQYTVEYDSLLRSAQEVDLYVQLDTPGLGKIRSEAGKLSVLVEPAQLRFQNLISELSVQHNQEGISTPGELPIEVSIDFPDNYPREIVSTSLWINDEKVKENKTAPYGSFLIDLNSYEESTTLNLEVKLDDAWGLQGRTGSHKLELEIIKPEGFLKEVSQGINRWLILGAGLGILILAFVFFFPGIRKKKASALAETNTVNQSSAIQTKPTQTDSSTSSDTPQDKADKTEKGTEPADGSDTENVSAYQELPLPPTHHYGSLIKLDNDNTPSAVKPFLLTKKVVYIGRDSKLADLVLDDPAIEPLHAELKLFEDGRATLTDFKTTAGTYRNFKALTSKAVDLQHGDILHFATLMYRFHSITRTRPSSSPGEAQDES
ncbi:MAG: FHA domain-containing protein [Chloroflexi bacterium]|nr:FHA domain-containing protein [Chloroflexota bacterium]